MNWLEIFRFWAYMFGGLFCAVLGIGLAVLVIITIVRLMEMAV